MPRFALVAALAAALLSFPATVSAESFDSAFQALVGRTAAVSTAPVRAQATGSAEYQDAAGDSGTGPDITTITVSNDDERMMTFGVSLPNRPAPRSEFVLAVFINADLDVTTGDVSLGGVDYVLLATAEGVALGHWDGSDMDFSQHTSVSGTYSSGPTFTFSDVDIGNTDTFSFVVATFDDFDDDSNFDIYPESGQSIYVLEITPVITGLDIPRGTLVAHAGKTFSLLPIELKLDTGEVVDPDERDCTAHLGSKALRELSGGCRWKLPKSARGKRIRFDVTLGYHGAQTTTKLTVRVTK